MRHLGSLLLILLYLHHFHATNLNIRKDVSQKSIYFTASSPSQYFSETKKMMFQVEVFRLLIWEYMALLPLGLQLLSMFCPQTAYLHM